MPNKATAEQLESAFQVDGTRARYLIQHRNKSGRFRSWDEVKQVPGFEDKMVENLRQAGLTIGDAETSEVSSGSRGRSGSTASDAQDRHVWDSEGQTRRAGSHQRGLDINTADPEELESAFQMDGNPRAISG
jgi:DNA uptake protein ComE-like DNA-binding protein